MAHASMQTEFFERSSQQKTNILAAALPGLRSYRTKAGEVRLYSARAERRLGMGQGISKVR